MSCAWLNSLVAPHCGAGSDVLRSWLRHERQTVAMVLAEACHHSSGTFLPTLKERRMAGQDAYGALRGQKTASWQDSWVAPQDGQDSWVAPRRACGAGGAGEGSHGRLRGCPSADAGGPSSRE